MATTYFTSEHVSPGHPDKICDTIAEAVVDYQIDNNDYSRTAVDGVIKNNTILLVGELTSTQKPDFIALSRKAIQEIGYTPSRSPLFNSTTINVTDIFTTQSPDIAQGVDLNGDIGAGDIGIMFGGAINEAPDFTGWAHYLARLISFEIYQYDFLWDKPDQKTQVTVRYEDGKAVAIDTIVCCVSHDENQPLGIIRNQITEYVKSVLDSHKIPLNYEDVKILVNPTGKFALYGPIADSGEVGRKIVCDQYGGYFAVGGGNLNGKDATKVDRSAVYMARYVAKHVVAAGLAEKCQIQVAYAIGVAQPVSIKVDCFGTENTNLEEIYKFVQGFDFSPKAIIERFKLTSKDRDFRYQELGMYGHIGEHFTGTILPWEA